MSTLKNQTIAIIGGSAGIGYGVALACLQSHARSVIIASSSPDRVNSAVQSLKTAGPEFSGKITGHVVNARDLASVKKFCMEIGAIDHLVFTSGDSLRVTELKETEIEEVKSAFDIRLWAPLQAAKYAQIKSGGSIVFTIGSVIRRPHPNWSFIAAGAGALDGATRGLAVDLAPIRVNVIAPGLVATELWAGMSAEQREGMYKTASENLLVKHVGTPAEIAEAYLFVMKCGYITGETIHVNGGQMLA